MEMNKKRSVVDSRNQSLLFEQQHKQSILFNGKPAIIIYERSRRGWEIKEINTDQSLNKK